MSIKERAVKNFKADLNCAQSVLSAYSKILGIDDKSAKAVTFGFGEGMGFAQKTCGAVSGGIMVIGCKYYDKDDIKGSKEKAYKKIMEFFERFERKYDSSDCRKLLGVDLKTGEGKTKYEEKNMFESKCLEYVKDACDILDIVLEDQ
jgi:C_GCAxxG_C_C family probable redox protein